MKDQTKPSKNPSLLDRSRPKQSMHFMGIGGTGMCALAQLCLARGDEVSGCDISTNANLRSLEKSGATIFLSHSSEHLQNIDTLIYSSAISPNEKELIAAKADSKITLLHRSDLLAEWAHEKQSILVAGTHGKTTTSALISHMLYELGLQPTAAIGGRMLNFDSNALYGPGPLFVAEADESDGSLVKYRSHVGVITNIDSDHLDVHGSLDGLQNVFFSFLSKIDPEGAAVIGWDCEILRNLATKSGKDFLSFGTLLGSDVRLLGMEIEDGLSNLDIVVERDRLKLKSKLIGKHNAQNILCALAVARVLELDVFSAAKAIEGFLGVARRLSLSFESPEVKIYDDYAHNPGKISAVLASLRLAYPEHEITVVYQPHRFSRLKTMEKEFAKAFTDADRVFVTPVYAAGEALDPLYTPSFVAQLIRQSSNIEAFGLNSLNDASQQVFTNFKRPAIILTAGAGDVWKISQELKDELCALSFVQKQKQELTQKTKTTPSSSPS